MGKHEKKRRPGQLIKWNALLDTIRKAECDFAEATLQHTTSSGSPPGYEAIAKGRVVAKHLGIRLGTTGVIHDDAINTVAAQLLTFDGDGETLPIDTVGSIVRGAMECGEFCVSKPSDKATDDKYLLSCPRAQNLDLIDPAQHPFLCSVYHPNAIVYVPAESVSRGDPVVRASSSDALGLTNAVTTAAASVQVTAATKEGTANYNSGEGLLGVQTFLFC
jgi:hypothetical protein